MSRSSIQYPYSSRHSSAKKSSLRYAGCSSVLNGGGGGGGGYSSPSQQPSDQLQLTAKAWCVVDGRSALRIIYRLKLNTHSLYFSVSDNAASIGGTSARLCESEWVLVEDLFYALMLPSGNDAAIVIAENCGCLLYFESIGQNTKFSEMHSVDITEDAYVIEYTRLFLKQMNILCEEYQLNCTHFSNPHGLSSRSNFSSAQDLAKLTHHCLEDERFSKIVSTKQHVAQVKYVEMNNTVTERTVLWFNTNKLLDKGFRGVKTGITSSAGGCLSSWYVAPSDESINIIVIVLGCLNVEQRFHDTTRIVKWILTQQISKQEQPMQSIKDFF